MTELRIDKIRKANNPILNALSEIELEVLVKALDHLSVNADEYSVESEIGYSNLEPKDIYTTVAEYQAYTELVKKGLLNPCYDDVNGVKYIFVHLTNKSYELIELIDSTYEKVEKEAPKEYPTDWKDYKFNKEQVVGEVNIPIKVTADEVETIIVNALEGGSTYWCGLEYTSATSMKPKGIPHSTWVTQMLLDGIEVMFYDIENEYDKFGLTLEKLCEGIKLNKINRPFDADLENGDADTADCILQFALFGKVVFG
ncbi:hypothetical protein ACIQ1D_18765 [Lysinibacillus xylanilyticus]|uniref:hypothetical protein n=1 Tax=Lysinibacillus xylanilyticus TaxID=582475 RepID=UPI0038194A89